MRRLHPESEVGIMAPKQTRADRERYLNELHAKCTAQWEQLSQLLEPGTALNTMEMRVNTLIQFFVDEGLIDTDQKLAFEIKFAETVEDSLIRLEKEYEAEMARRKQAAQQPKLVSIKKPDTLLGPDGRPIG